MATDRLVAPTDVSLHSNDGSEIMVETYDAVSVTLR